MSLSNTGKAAGNDSFAEESIQILREAYLAKRLVLFVGAGMDAGSGIPCRKDAVREFCSRLHLEYEDGLDDVRIPQYYFQAHGNQQYVELCKKIFCDQTRLCPNAFHKKIADLHVHTIITTSYSDLLQQEMHCRGYLYTTVCQDKELSYVRNEKRIIKMHGDFAHDNFVLKEEDYVHYESRFRRIAAYVKSVLANNMVLFVGYSLRDPEIRQLFSWVKETAGGDLLQAYMLESDRDYNENAFAYYKKNGVGVIYTKNFADQKQDALFSVMDRIGKKSAGQSSHLEEAKNYFEPFLHLNYILRRNIEKGLSKCNLGIHADQIWALGGQDNRQKETNELIIKLIPYLKKEPVIADNPYSVLAGALERSGIRQIELYLCDENQNETRLHAQTIEILHMENELLPLLLTFDYQGIQKKTEDFAFSYQEQHTYAQQAFGYYLLGDYIKAYRVLCKAAKNAFQNKQCVPYYLAQRNRQRIGEMIKSGDVPLKIPQDIYEQIQKETADIDAESIAADLSGMSFSDAAMRKEIDSFQLYACVFQDVYEMVQTLEKRRQAGCADAAGRAEIEKLRLYVKDFYRYLISNGIMADRSLQAEETFLLYLGWIQKNMGFADAFTLTQFDLFLMIRYLTPKEILNTLAQNNIEELAAASDGIAMMKTILRNLQSAEDGRKQKSTDTELWNSLLLGAWIHPDEELAELVIDIISSTSSIGSIAGYPNLQGLNETKEMIAAILRSLARQHACKKKQPGDFRMDDYAAGRLWNRLLCMILSEKDTATMQKAGRLMQEVADIFCQIYQEGYPGEIEELLCREKAFLAAKMYPYCNARNQEKIRRYFADWNPDSRRFYEIYADIVLCGVIEPNSDFEQKIFERLYEIKKMSGDGRSGEYEEILLTLYRLSMDKKLAHTKDLKEALIKSEQPMLQFLGDMESFDYSAFRLEWLGRFSDKTLKKTAFHKTARSNIIRRFIEEHAKGETDRFLLTIYFRYFAGMDGL